MKNAKVTQPNVRKNKVDERQPVSKRQLKNKQHDEDSLAQLRHWEQGY